MKVNQILSIFFISLWAVAFHIAYFKNHIYFVFIAIALAIDLVRLSSEASTRLYAQIVANRLNILAATAALFCLQCWLVLSDAFPQIAFEGPYEHYRIALESVSTVYAALIYVLESSGAVIGALIIGYYGIQLSATQAVSFFQETNRILAKIDPRKESRKLLAFFVSLYAFQVSVAIIAIRNALPRVYEYHPQNNPIQLALFSSVPVFFALGMKAWLREVMVYQGNESGR